MRAGKYMIELVAVLVMTGEEGKTVSVIIIWRVGLWRKKKG